MVISPLVDTATEMILPFKRPRAKHVKRNFYFVHKKDAKDAQKIYLQPKYPKTLLTKRCNRRKVSIVKTKKKNNMQRINEEMKKEQISRVKYAIST